jgi:hypothetical protein
MCEWWDYSRGLSIDLHRNKVGSKHYGISQGPKQKTTLSFFFLGLETDCRLQVASAGSWPFRSQGGGGSLALG